jgi:GTPase
MTEDQDTSATSSDGRHCAVVAVVGAPNAGKSTLVNALVGTKVSIVSATPQTTRTRVMGIMGEDKTQIVYVDTPGLFKPQRRLERAMTWAAWESLTGADVAITVVDAARARLQPEVTSLISRLAQTDIRRVLVLNKIDSVRPPKLLELSARLNDLADFERTFMISALKGSGVADIGKFLIASAPEGPWLFPGDQLSDLSDRQLAAEILREKLFMRLRQELPHELTVETESWEVFRDGSVRIGMVIYVRRDSQKAIVLGEGGSMIRAVGESARKELEEILGHRVHSSVFVKVRPDWPDDPERYEAWGLDFRA